jgi:hypothetical protein
MKQLARKFKVSESAVRGIIKRKNWKHIPPAETTYPQYQADQKPQPVENQQKSPPAPVNC